ncbi:MAG TPA: bifunctional alpha,alpha-trehalose-phosphate synthase (UDP-forming)/trehalose-phosphatase [Prolixibacteraceae bacterium]|nr:bifunctional alpha,alpha-trehalose-phosphate synthase (UDP-forming)/trehalose-phosphatase [Prolixibacteraceae bacterium]
MKKIHILSNRLPFNVQKTDSDFHLTPSVGGLATGMRSIYKTYKGYWIGWPGVASDEMDAKGGRQISQLLRKENCIPVHLSADEIVRYYEGFSNRTIWPLFHYFSEYVDYEADLWNAYLSVNQKFADEALKVVNDGDTVWVHDYQLLMVPRMIKEKKPGVTIGFFLHIPFPSYEVFRILPWRKELISGMLGADLIGFHTYDYERHFLSSVRRLLGFEINFNQIHTDDRIVSVDAFPMGIDYVKFEQSAEEVMKKSIQEKSDLHRELDKFFLMSPERKLILSIDRMDYTKGIPNRLKAFSQFLEKHEAFRGKVTLVMLAVPSRDQVDRYQHLKRRVDEWVGYINGQYGTINYTPVWYFYRSLPFENLIELYTSSDVALITPVRDGMNLVAKEYVASRVNQTGVIIISEMAGVSKEMGEALIINPNDIDEIAESIYRALMMDVKEQKERMQVMQTRIRRYDVFKWASDFVRSLEKIRNLQAQFYAKRITPSLLDEIREAYRASEKRAVFIDYDGTLAHFVPNPQDARPDEEIHEIIRQLTVEPKNEVVIISGRERDTLERWFEGIPVNLIAEHGVWIQKRGGKWKMFAPLSNSWKDKIRPALEFFVDRTPGSFIEEKNFSLVWHYRKSEPEQGALRANELKDELTNLIANHNLEIMEGNKVIEVKRGGINKGSAALRFMGNTAFDFVLAIGDDWTDEYMFRELPEDSVTVKVGLKHTSARYKVDSVPAARAFLKKLGQS